MSGSRLYAQSKRLHSTEKEYATRPYGVVTTTVNPETDEFTYTGPRTGRTAPVSHPYLGPSSWIRVMPERNTKMILDSRVDTGETFTSAYMAENGARDLIRATYDDSRFYYRRLREGEIEITSPGLASAHFSADGTLSLRGGAVTLVLDTPNMEINQKAPTVVTRALDNSVTRFGVVKRLLGSDQPQETFIKVTPEGSSEVFAKEYLRVLTSKASPSVLVDHREGHVFSNEGTEPTSAVTGKKLRSLTRYGTSNEEESTVEVDIDGNVNLSLPDSSSYGLNVKVSRTDIKLEAGRDAIIDVDRNFMVNAEQTVELEGTRIKSGRNANNAMMLGDEMRTWLRNATVLTATGPARFLSSDVEVQFTQVLSTKSFVE